MVHPDRITDPKYTMTAIHRARSKNIKGNPLGISSYDNPHTATWSPAAPPLATTFYVTEALHKKTPFVLADFATKPLSLKEIEYCTAERTGEIISGMRVRGKTYYVETKSTEVKADPLMVYFTRSAVPRIYHDSRTIHSLSGNASPNGHAILPCDIICLTWVHGRPHA